MILALRPHFQAGRCSASYGDPARSRSRARQAHIDKDDDARSRAFELRSTRGTDFFIAYCEENMFA